MNETQSFRVVSARDYDGLERRYERVLGAIAAAAMEKVGVDTAAISAQIELWLNEAEEIRAAVQAGVVVH